MLRAIDFDHQPLIQTDEIHYVGADRELAAELEPLKPAIAQLKPEPLLGQGRFGSQLLGKGAGFHGSYPALSDSLGIAITLGIYRAEIRPPHPSPLPEGEGTDRGNP
ncbi:hypothetical protein D3C80_1808650 [compost metagenome]